MSSLFNDDFLKFQRKLNAPATDEFLVEGVWHNLTNCVECPYYERWIEPHGEHLTTCKVLEELPLKLCPGIEDMQSIFQKALRKDLLQEMEAWDDGSDED